MTRQCTVTILLSLSTLAWAAEPLPDKVDFNRDIKPILSDNCYACHGPDAGTVKAGLRLDSFEAATKELKSGATAIVPKDTDESELVYRVHTTDADELMPPAESNKSLTAREKALLKQWVAQGGEFAKHWAYVAPKKTAAPKAEQKGFTHNDIDRFILARLKSNGFVPAKEADRRTLIRRLSFDLTGLPPTWGQVEAFVNDKSPDAYAKLVDRLLASPQYGERMAVYWLDMVRYADTIGYHSDNHETKPLYRDYVIDAFNDNKPYDQFTREQLAGDLINDRTGTQLIASGYNRLNMNTREGGSQPKEYTAKYLADRVRNTSTVWMASTLGCSECHDHKFDPFTAKDFYSFGAFFADLEETPVGGQKFTKVPRMEDKAKVASLEVELAELRKQIAEANLSTGQKTWEAGLQKTLTESSDWQAIKPTSAKSFGGATLKVQADHSVLSTGKNPAKDDYTITLATNLKNITGIRLEALTHESFPTKSLARGNGNFVLTHFSVAKGKSPVKIASATSDYSQANYPVANALKPDAKTGWAGNGHVEAANRTAVFVFEKPVAGGDDTTLTITLKHQSQYPNHNIGHFRLSLTTAAEPTIRGGHNLPPVVAAALKQPTVQRDAAQQKAIADHYRTIAPELTEMRKAVAAKAAARDAAINTYPTTLVSTSMSKPRMVRVLPRGNWLDDSGDQVQPAVPGFLQFGQAPEGRASRMDLADWIVARDNPLTARVFVNRLWAMFHGRGLATPLDDFGAQGTPPTHPALLDWLAIEFMENSWDVKHMVKLMVSSGTYRQSSVSPKAVTDKDPYNLWLARQGRWRLEAEMVRDNALAVSGLLVKTIGGASAKPYQPAGYWAHLNFPKRSWKADAGEGLYRRGLYTYWCRTFLHPSLAAFNAPSREECTVERVRSNTPQQALVLLNDPTYVEAARIFAERILKDGGKTPESRIAFAYQLALHRAPSAAEAKILVGLADKHLKHYQTDAVAADALLKNGAKMADEALDKYKLAAWTSIARVVLNLHENITRN